MKKIIVKLEQTADQLNLTLKTLNPNQLSSIKQEIQVLKGFPTNQTTSDSDNDGIIVISEQ
jgi:hypothetical protein